MLIGSLAWAIWEVGFDWWQLGPRGGVIVLPALWLLTPWVRRGLKKGACEASIPLAVGVLATLAAADFSMIVDPHDLAGELPVEQGVRI